MNRAARLAPRGDWVLAGRLGGYYDLRYYRRCDHLVGNTRGLVRWIVAQGWPASRAHYLPNFAADLAGAVPERLGMPLDRPLVLALGRLHRNKAFDVLIRALPRLPGVHAVIAGEGPERPALGGPGDGGRRGGPRAHARLAAGHGGTAGRLRRAGLPVAPRAAGQRRLWRRSPPAAPWWPPPPPARAS